MSASWEFEAPVQPVLPSSAVVYGGTLMFSGDEGAHHEQGAGEAFVSAHEADAQPWMFGSAQLLELWLLAAQIHSGEDCARDLLNKEQQALGRESVISLACRSEAGFRRSVGFLSNAVVVDWLTNPRRHRPPPPGLVKELKELGLRPDSVQAARLLRPPPCCAEFAKRCEAERAM